MRKGIRGTYKREKSSLTQNEVRSLITYDESTGRLFWKFRELHHFKGVSNQQKRWNSTYSGKEAFTSRNNDGYNSSSFLGIKIKAHILIWFYMTGKWPIKQIDHIDGDRSNNSWNNLRQVNVTENARNRALQKNNKSGVCGVTWNKRQKSWQAGIGENGKKKFIGYFKTIEEAQKAREIEMKSMGYSSRHGMTI